MAKLALVSVALGRKKYFWVTDGDTSLGIPSVLINVTGLGTLTTDVEGYALIPNTPGSYFYTISHEEYYDTSGNFTI